MVIEKCRCNHANACNIYAGEHLCNCCFLIRVGIVDNDTWVAGDKCVSSYCMPSYDIPNKIADADEIKAGGNGNGEVKVK